MERKSKDKLPTYFKYWGKALKDPVSGEFNYHLLPYHCLDVAAVADVWLEKSNVLLNQISSHIRIPKEQSQRIVIFYILLHDLGKFDARFQSFCEDIRKNLQGDLWTVEQDPIYYSHGSCGYKQFGMMFGSNEAMKAVAGHHGHCDVSINYDPPDADEQLVELDRRARREWVKFCLNFCKLEAVPDVGEIPMLAGLCSVSDWVGSSMTNFTTDPNIDLQEYYQLALCRAKEVLKETGMIEKLQGAGFDFLFSSYAPRGIQTLLDRMPLKAGLTLVESDTGSGKTEFSLAYASMLIKAGFADGVVFGLPTQATANGLFKRVGEAANNLFPDAQTTLAHGKSKFIFSDESGFLQQSNKRAFLGSMSVATIDQILMGVLGVRHQFVRSFGTRKSVLILDEIHSFDAYMMGLIQQVLKGQHQSFSSVILLSATLPNTLKEKLLASYQGESLSQLYPLVSHTDLHGNTQEFTVSDIERNQSTKKIIVSQLWRSENVLPNTDQLEQIREWVENGAMVGVICNTVADAQRLYCCVSNMKLSFPVDLFHARYTFEDRNNIEGHVIRNYDKNATRKGRLLIATQVIEQSLDLDFDVLISQIAPIEYLMQRMGRLWRHERRGGDLCNRTINVKEPLFITLLPDQNITSDMSIDQLKQHYQGSGYVYQDTRLLYRTEKYLNESLQLTFPDCYRLAIDLVHNPLPYPEEPLALKKIAEAYDQNSEGSNYTARQISNVQSKPLNDVDPRCALLTRDGEMSVSVVLLKKDGSLLHGGNIDEQQDRESSTVALAVKHAKGKKDDRYYCLKAVVGKDIIYNEIGVISSDLMNELNTRGF